MGTGEHKTGKQLLSNFGCETRTDKLERAVGTLMAVLNELHIETKGQCLITNLHNPNIFCSCADAYRMGLEALKE
jgi:hypothetical protein